ncbi:MAG: GspH/FimT family pseudopilin [Gammaproteobacteria bacterium]|nr:GspH/FimT family pseudopilin [Gammaproteobacteria bacterium]
MQRGFSLIELMVALVVLAIALGIGVPVFTTMAANERMSSATNDLVTSLHGARSEALMRRAPVALCPTPDGAGACIDGGNLALGWTVFVDRNEDGSISADDVILQRHAGLHPDLRDGVTTTPAALRFTNAGSLRFDPGAPFTDYNIQLCDGRGDVDTGAGIAAGRWIQISPLGRQQLVRARATIQSDRNPLGGC